MFTFRAEGLNFTTPHSTVIAKWHNCIFLFISLHFKIPHKEPMFNWKSLTALIRIDLDLNLWYFARILFWNVVRDLMQVKKLFRKFLSIFIHFNKTICDETSFKRCSLSLQNPFFFYLYAIILNSYLLIWYHFEQLLHQNFF